MKSEGQVWALEQLAQIVQARPELVEVLDVKDPTEERGRVSVTLSLNCTGYVKKPGGIPFKARERLLLTIPANFPFGLPGLDFTHKRYGDFSHVQWGAHICLYQAPDSEWQPEDGLFGFMKRVDEWFSAGAANELDPVGMPLHPPIAYARSNLTVVPTQNTPVPTPPFWAGYAEIKLENVNRVELGKWIHYQDPVPDGRLAAVILMPATMPHEYPTTFAGLLKELASRNVDADVVRIVMQLGALRNESGKPLLFVLGAANRGIAGVALLQHLTCWQIGAAQADEIRQAINASTASDPTDIAHFQTWAASANVEWCTVLEDRPEIVTRRDSESAAAWWKGRHAVIFGCGAIGSAVAIMLARAGVAKLVLYDTDIVKPGILVRQLFSRYQIGMNKAEATAKNTLYANPSMNVQHSAADVVSRLDYPERLAEILAADVLINATASTKVATALEKKFRAWPKVHPPIVSMVLGHKADQAMVTFSAQGAPGITTDIDRRTKIALSNSPMCQHVLEEFWPKNPGRTRLFQPEPGCSSPTFRGSAADVLALTAQMTNVAARWLADGATNLSRAKTIDATGTRSGSMREFEFEWPSQVTLNDGRNGYQIRVSAAAVNGILTWMRRSERVNGSRVETGGILFGQIDEFMKIIWVDEISGPPSDSTQSADAFVCGTAGVAEMNKEKAQRTRGSVAFVGMWHTHPGGLPLPSPTDYGAMAILLTGDEFPGRHFLMMIVGADSSQPIVSGTVFERADYQQ